MPVGKQLDILIHELRISQTEFARQTNLSKQTVNNIISERHITKSDVLEKISERYPQVNMNWLLSGQGSIWLKNGAPVKVKQKDPEPVNTEECKNCQHLKKQIELMNEIIRSKNEVIETQNTLISKLNY